MLFHSIGERSRHKTKQENRKPIIKSHIMFPSSASSKIRPPWLSSARNNWLKYRNVWSSVVYKHAHSQAMNREELKRFSLIQNWLNENALEAKQSFREALLLSQQQKSSTSSSRIAGRS